ncbi:N-carbamoyl-L-amino-acid hydrolase [Modestobacter sp. DSM 44400]|uniref:allantoate amidohydrolase n=1 Tax=Modestobacter sp. DSM 44400 TaxID=1550230 RepID=UPI00089875DD|nr:allantoate amidohydrolase [Modestobacter sp. DSM 44400]SDY27769.1 N-carbamoyl-L-amino-acid hydrolase [Modestobacter sp. DSM 44400]
MTTTTAGPTVPALLRAIADTGRDRTRGGYSRHLFSDAEMDLREWFLAEATARGLETEIDRNANLWAWWRPGGAAAQERAIVTGSHLDSVPGGGAFDGPLGVVSALATVDLLRAAGLQPRRPLGIVVFAEEEGGRFGVACLGSRLLTGTTTPDAALALTDPDGNTLAESAARVGVDATRFGADPDRLDRIACFVELHVEQGRGLIDLGQPIALASSVLAHGRWHLRFTGEGNHAGATPMDSRHDPLLPAAQTVLAARRAAAAGESLRATVGRLRPHPGGTNVIASAVDLWMDARGPDAPVTQAMVAEIAAAAHEAAAAEGCRVEIREESASGAVHFDLALRDQLHSALTTPAALAGTGATGLPVLATGAGHDAAILGAAPGTRRIPTAMLFVRNPTGVSHSPAEFAEDDDCERGGTALATVLTQLLS